jgi:hypothetical protein
MSNGNYVNSELEFEKSIANMPDRTLLEFVARQNYETCIRCEKHNSRITSLEKQSKRVSSITGGVTGLISAVIVAVIDCFVRN